MRKPRDFNAEIEALTDKTKRLKDRKVRQLGELVVATAADTLEPDLLAGALLAVVEAKDSTRREAWRARGAAFFRGRMRDAAKGADGSPPGGSANDGSAAAD